MKSKSSNSKVNFNWSIKFKGFDFDRDGLLDFKDCKPFDKKRHHFYPNATLMKELTKLPIFFAGKDEDLYGWRRLYVISTDEYGKLIYVRINPYNKQNEEVLRVPKRVYDAIQRFFMVVKERPDILKSIKRRKTNVVFTAGSDDPGIYGHVPLHGKYAVVNLSGRKGIPFGYHGEEDFLQSDVQEGAGTVHHELKHIEQHQTMSPSKWMPTGGKLKKVDKRNEKVEREAQMAERRETIRRYRYPSKKKMEKAVKEQFFRFDELGGHFFK